MQPIPARAEKLSNDVIGAAIEVHRVLGPGHREKIYSRALAVEFDLRDIPFERESSHSVVYKDHELGHGRIDFVVGQSLVVELKAVEQLVSEHKSQVISYLKVSDNRLGLLLNFNKSTLKDGIERVVFTKD